MDPIENLRTLLRSSGYVKMTQRPPGEENSEEA